MTAEGWTIVAASGDHGAYDNCSGASVDFPASNPNVVAVGGTRLSVANVGGAPRFVGEAAWGGAGCAAPGGNGGGGGGGCSAVEPAGPWQSLVPSLVCGRKRSVPDLALNSGTGSRSTGSGKWKAIGGTSIAAPVFAGFMARVNAYLLSLGNVCGPAAAAPCSPYGGPERRAVADGPRRRRRDLPRPVLRHHERLQRRQPGPGLLRHARDMTSRPAGARSTRCSSPGA